MLTVTPFGCEGLPESDGDFTIRVAPLSSEADLELSRRAESAAWRYLRVWPKRCEAFFPLIRRGDPFFHVYVRCEGVVEAVLEFRIVNGQPAEFSHWDYTRKGANLPEGAGARLGVSSLWLSSRVVGSNVEH